MSPIFVSTILDVSGCGTRDKSSLLTSFSPSLAWTKKPSVPRRGSLPYNIHAEACFNHAVSALVTRLRAASSTSTYPLCSSLLSLSINCAAVHAPPPFPPIINCTTSHNHSILLLHGVNSATTAVSETMLYPPTSPASSRSILPSTSSTLR